LREALPKQTPYDKEVAKGFGCVCVEIPNQEDAEVFSKGRDSDEEVLI
jgi:hypothetical protein